MKILWICNIIPSIIAKKNNIIEPVVGGWIDGSIIKLLNCGYNLSVCFPMDQKIDSDDERFSYHSFQEYSKVKYEKKLENYFSKIFTEYKPDIIHVHGTEYPHSLAAINAADMSGMIDKVIISIQGLVNICASHYLAGISLKTAKSYTIRDFIKSDNIIKQKKNFVIQGKYEIETLRKTLHVIGRTEWDLACTRFLAPNALYHHCNETLRNGFYESKNAWNYERCEKHSIFVSQSNYPLKGFHHAIEMVSKLNDLYGDIKLYTTGIDPFSIPKYRINSYQKYIRDLINKLGLKEKVIFLGKLSADEMIDRYLKSNVFVSASSIENSSNSIGEAMILGMPIVASYVGGTMDMLCDKNEGYLYQYEAPYMLTHYVNEVFNRGASVKDMGERAYLHASHTHDPEKNLKDLIEIYSIIIHK